MTYTLRISPCPNDTFAFYALLHSKIEMNGAKFEVEFHDIETLNSMLLSGSADIIKASVAVTVPAKEQGYKILNAGAALGRGNGPVVVRSSKNNNKVVALPGELTTATLLFNRYFEGYTPVYTLFNNVANLVEDGTAELGVLIHEGRFTFRERGLELVADLGEKWEAESGLPLPLGGIYGREDIDLEMIEDLIRRSIRWAFEHPSEPLDFVRAHASELSDEVMQNHIDYFVNQYSLDLGTDGRAAIDTLTNNNRNS